MATWSLCGRHAGPDRPPTPVFINLDNVLTVERQSVHATGELARRSQRMPRTREALRGIGRLFGNAGIKAGAFEP